MYHRFFFFINYDFLFSVHEDFPVAESDSVPQGTMCQSSIQLYETSVAASRGKSPLFYRNTDD